jgi:cobalamin 5'-phosphate synthase/cobalamin synthase
VKAVLIATAFLTRVPVPVTAGAVDVGGAVRWFPLVGGALGGAAALIAWAMTEALGFPASLSATLVVGLGAWVTGAIHLDGLADMADGFGGGQSREDVLRIMRDPVIGSYGTTALVIVIGMKVTALVTLLDRGVALPFLIAAPAISRWTISALAAWLPYARTEGGLGKAVTHERDTIGLVVATVVTALIAIGALCVDALIVWAFAALTAVWIARTARRRIGGVTGDVFGATVELTETSVLLCGVLLTGGA